MRSHHNFTEIYRAPAEAEWMMKALRVVMMVALSIEKVQTLWIVSMNKMMRMITYLLTMWMKKW
jgi:hypothetical protein